MEIGIEIANFYRDLTSISGIEDRRFAMPISIIDRVMEIAIEIANFY